MLENKNLKITSGIIEKIDIIERTGDNLIKIRLSGDLNEYSMFGELEALEDDRIKFNYIIKDGRYYNIKNILEYAASSGSALNTNNEDATPKKFIATYGPWP